MKNRQATIDAWVDDFTGRDPMKNIGTSFSQGMMQKHGAISVPQKKFIRWLSKEEYGSILQKAKVEVETRDDDEIYFMDAWDLLIDHEKQSKLCSTCPLTTYLGTKKNPIVEKLKGKLKKEKQSSKERMLHSIYKQLVPSRKANLSKGEFRSLAESDYPHLSEVVEFLARSLDSMSLYKNHAKRLRIEHNQWKPRVADCYKSSCYSHWGTFFDFLSEHGNFEILRQNTFEDEEQGSVGEIPADQMRKLAGELKKAREILETVKVPAMNIYDCKGNRIGLCSYDTGMMYGNQTYGYGVGLEGDEKGIAVMHKTEGIFDLPVSVRKAVLEEDGLGGIIGLSAQIRAAQPRFYFQKIIRENNTFYGISNGCRIELPPENCLQGTVLTPFSGFEGSEKIGCLEYTQSSAMRSFGYLQRLLEKHLNIAQEFDIPIIGR